VGGFIEETLAAKGLKRANSGEDLQVSFRIEVVERPQFVSFSSGWWGDPFWGPGWSPGFGGPAWSSGITTTSVEMFYDGTLVIDIVDARQKRVIFEGTSTQSVSSRPEKNSRKLAKAVAEVLAKYPAQ
jgi:hypothetical protein